MMDCVKSISVACHPPGMAHSFYVLSLTLGNEEAWILVPIALIKAIVSQAEV